jgi:hypothetical protein
MLFLPAHVWTRTQRSLIIVAIILALGLFGTTIYTYERYCRGPNESLLFGTWQCVDGCYSKNVELNPTELDGRWHLSDRAAYYRFRLDHNFEILSPDSELPNCIPPQKGTLRSAMVNARWYAGGTFIYLRVVEPHVKIGFPKAPREIVIWRIEDIGPTELRVQLRTDEPSRVYRRVDVCAPSASNKSLEPTASRYVTSLFMTKTFSLQAPLALASGGSAPSR